VGLRDFVKDQPFLAGCIGCGFTSLLVCGGFVALGLLGGVKVASCAGEGFDSMLELQGDAAEAGFGWGLYWDNGARSIRLDPLTTREVTCADLEAVVFPHLTGELETLTLTSTSWASPSSSAPVTCNYSGYPTAP